VPGTRAHPRYALEIDAEVRVGERSLPARTRNISRGGMAITTRNALPVGAGVTISLALVFALGDEKAMSEPLPLQGRIVWCSPLVHDTYQLGLMFVGVRAEERSYVDMFIRYLKE
jgi:c-di-GMP-binding flagellar brake protein YcgR